jgi:hypothetical protein
MKFSDKLLQFHTIPIQRRCDEFRHHYTMIRISRQPDHSSNSTQSAHLWRAERCPFRGIRVYSEQHTPLPKQAGLALSYADQDIAPTAEATSMPLTPGDTFFEYRITRALGQGAFGTVYLAQDTLLDRPVAIKELTAAAQADPVAFQRFLQEARAAMSREYWLSVRTRHLEVT